MKKLLLRFLIFSILFFPKNLSSQDDNALLAAAGILTLGAMASSIDNFQELLELCATEYILSNYPSFNNFELRLASTRGVKSNDLSNVNVITYELADNNNRYVLFLFASKNWTNSSGVDFTKLIYKLFDKNDWNLLMQNYIKTASELLVPTDEIANYKIFGNLFKDAVDNLNKFKKIGGDMYLVSDYSDEFKVVYNERTLGLFIKATNELVQIKNSTIFRTHTFLNDL